MNVKWKALFSFGFAFWGLLCATDLLGDSTWKKCSSHVDDILKGQYNGLLKMQETKIANSAENSRQKMNWPMLLWNICAFLCSLLFCSVIKSMSWFAWRLFKIYNVFRNRKSIASKLICAKIPEAEPSPAEEKKTNCKVLFRNQLFVAPRQDTVVNKELEELKKEKSELCQQLTMAQKENMTARQQIEEYKLETFMMKEKLARTANTLKENLKYRNFTNANQEIIARKAHSLESHLKEVCRDRDLLRSKLSNLESSYSKLQERLLKFEKGNIETSPEHQFPEKDTNKPSENEAGDSEATDMDMKSKKRDFEANSKISVDLDESSFEASKENDSENSRETKNESKRPDIDAIKQNILNFSAYRAQMLRPKLKLSNIKERMYAVTDTTGSSSEDNSGSCHRIISSTAEFQNFLKTLTSQSVGRVDFDKNF